jgi:hypothetical protein
MKKVIFTLIILSLINVADAATYYWIGGTSASSWTSGSNWTTDPVGRAPVGGSITIGTTDVFIFDGTNVGGASPVTGPVTLVMSSLNATPFAQLQFKNGANVTLTRSATGSSNITLNGDGTSANDLIVDGTSVLTLGGTISDYNIQIVLGASATASISGTIYFTPLVFNGSHTRSYITVPTAGNLVFETGSKAYSNDSSAVSCFNSSIAKSVVFKTGSSLYYYWGRSPIGNNSTTQISDFQPGSNLYIRGSNAGYTSSSWTNNKYYGNLFIENNTTYVADGPLFFTQNVTIDAGSTFTLHTSGQTGFTGDLTVNGTLNAPVGSTNTIVMGANGSANISGSGTIDIPAFVNSAVTNLQLLNNVGVQTSSTVMGTVDFGTKQMSGAGTFSARGPQTTATYTGAITPGSYQITGVTSPTSIAGMIVSGTGIPANTVVLTYSSSNSSINISQPATNAATGATTTFSFDAPNATTLVTSNTNGYDSTSGSVIMGSTKTFNSSVNYTFNGATTTPFNTSPYNSNNAGNIILNAGITTNKSIATSGTLTLNSGKLTIRSIDTVRVTSGNAISGGPFSSSKYIVTQVNTTNGDQGRLRIDGFSSARTFPVGSATNYLPVTLTPLSASDFAVTAFENITNDGTPNGTAMIAAQKAEVVNAVWTINRISANTDNCDVTLNWTSSLEGSTFTTLSNSQIGVARHNGTTWGVVGGSGDNTANFATNTFNTFSPFGVGRVGVVLPLRFLNFNAVLSNNKVALQWNVQNELGLDKYIVERSSNGINFSTVTNIASKNLLTSQYDIVDPQTLSGVAYYRIKSVSSNGQVNYTGIVKVSGTLSSQLEVYPNPVRGNVINLSFKPATEGTYSMILINSAGQQVLSKPLGLVQNNFNSSMVLPNNIQPGVYTLIIRSNESQLKQTILIQ